MPIVEVEGQQFEFPEGTSDKIIGNAIRTHFDDDKSDLSLRERVNQEILNAPGGSALAELGSAVSRGSINLADFFVGKPLQAVQKLSGVDEPIPTVIGETELGKAAATGQFLEPGLSRDVIRTGGELIAPGAVVGAGLRGAAKGIPQVQAAARTLGQRVTQQLGAGTAGADVAGAGLAGAGLEIGGETGEAVDIALGGTGETGKQVGEFIGSIAFPITGAVTTQVGKNLATEGAKKLLKGSAPTIDGLKAAARQVYKEIDDLGAVINSSRVNRLGGEVQSIVRKEGFDVDIHPKVNAVLRRFSETANKDLTVTELDTLRKVARNAASSNEPSEKRLGSLIVNKIDDTLDDLKPSDFRQGGGEVGVKFRDARQLWQRAKKSELIEDAFAKASLQATGFENGIRTQFRQILNNKKKLTGFTKQEKQAMRRVVKGTSLQNLAKMIGRFGFSEGQASNMLLGSLGVAGGASVFGAPGAVAIPLIGQVSRNLAQKLTRKGAELTNTVIRAGKNGERVANAYIKAVPARQRSAEELSELLLRPEVSLKQLESKLASLPSENRKLISDAVFFAKAIQDRKEDLK